MYRISKDGVVLTYTDTLYYVRKNPKNGCLVQCKVKDAEGVAISGTAYNLIGLDKTLGDEVELVFAQAIDTGAELNRIPVLEAKNAELESKNKELTAKLDAEIESGSTLEECIVEMAEVVYA